MGEISPGVAEIMRVGFMGVVGAFVLLAKVIASALEQIKELGASSTPEFESMTAAIEKQKAAIEEVELAALSYERTLKKLDDAKESVQAASAAYLAVLNQQNAAEQSLNEKRQARDEALLNAAEEAGLISHTDHIARKLAMDGEYARKRIALENQVQRAALAEKYRERGNTEIEAGALERDLPGKTEAAKRASGAKTFAEKQLESDRENLKKTEEKLKELQKQDVELHEPGFDLFKSEYMILQERKQNKIETESEMNTAAMLRDRIKQDEERTFRSKDAASAAQEDLEDTRGRLKGDRGRIHELDRELPREEDKFRRDQDTRNQGEQYDSQGRQAQAIGQLSREAAALPAQSADAVNQHAQIIQQVSSSLTQLTGMQSKTTSTLQSHQGTVQALSLRVNDLERAAKNQNSQMIEMSKMVGMGH